MDTNTNSKGKTKKAATTAPAPAPAKVATVHMAGTDAPTLCHNWNPKVSIIADAERVTCKVCLAALHPKEKKKVEEGKPPVVIVCSVCGRERVVPASQAHSVTRCEACQKAYLRGKVKARAKVKKTEKRGNLRHIGSDMLAYLREAVASGVFGDIREDEAMRATATYIYATYPKVKKA
jgi:RNase P subunit RPR2